MCERVMLTPLTAEEQSFAEENYETLQWCIRNLYLDDDHKDIAAFGYLHAIKKWYARPDLHKWSFKTIVRQTVRSHIATETQKAKCRIQPISLDEVIPGTTDLTYGAVVTYDHMDYLKGEQDMSMKIDFNVKIPEVAKLGRTPCVEIETLVTFIDSNHKTMSLTYQDEKIALTKSQTLRSWVRSKKMTADIKVYKMASIIYIEKITQERKEKRTS